MNISKLLTILLLVSVVAACGESQDPTPPVCQFPDKCQDDGGNDEVGENEPGELPSGECSADASEVRLGLKHQCEGGLQMGFEFSYGQQGCDDLLAWPPCEQDYVFGFEDYVGTKVMACCGEWDGTNQQATKYRQYCMGDLVEQVCLSAAEQLTTGANMLAKGVLQDAVLEIQNHVAANTAVCLEALRLNDIDEDPDILNSYWELPDMLGLTGIKLVVSSGEISSFSLPDDPTDCNSNQANNDETFDPPVPMGIGPAWDATLASAAAVIASGPELFGSAISGAGNLASSRDRDCATEACSSITITEDSPDRLLVTALELVADGPAQIGNDLGSATIERGRIELRGGALAQRSAAGDHVVDIGTAHFMIVGEVEGEIRRIAGTNASPIALLHVDATWQTSNFDIAILDEQGQRWIVSIPASHWR